LERASKLNDDKKTPFNGEALKAVEENMWDIVDLSPPSGISAKSIL